MSKIVDLIVSEEKKIVSWFKTTEPKLRDSLIEAARITKNFNDWMHSKAGVTVEEAIVRFVPQGQVWTNDVLKVVQTVQKDLDAVTSPIAIGGISIRLMAEITAIIHGKALPSGIAGYIQEAQYLFLG